MKKKTFKNHFDKFPPILRQMVRMNMDSNMADSGLYYSQTPLRTAFIWHGSDEGHDFWDAVEADAIHHKIWEVKP